MTVNRKSWVGSVAFPLSEQLADTINQHGLAWTARRAAERGVKVSEFLILARQALPKNPAPKV